LQRGELRLQIADRLGRIKGILKDGEDHGPSACSIVVNIWFAVGRTRGLAE
jgi:hypothetical protein